MEGGDRGNTESIDIAQTDGSDCSLRKKSIESIGTKNKATPTIGLNGAARSNCNWGNRKNSASTRTSA